MFLLVDVHCLPWTAGGGGQFECCFQGTFCNCRVYWETLPMKYHPMHIISVMSSCKLAGEKLITSSKKPACMQWNNYQVSGCLFQFHL